MPSYRTKKQRLPNSVDSGSNNRSLGPSPDHESAKVIQKGLTIGHDNWADMNADGLARIELAQNRGACVRMFKANGNPNPTDEQLYSFLRDCFAKIDFGTAKIVAAHPKADDESVCYSVFPDTPWGELTIRWWADITFGFCFDLVDIEQRKVRAIPEDLEFVRPGRVGKYNAMKSLEEGHRLANLGGATVRYPRNADGIVEERFAIPPNSPLGIRKKGQIRPFVMTNSPARFYHPEAVHDNVPVIALTRPS